MQLQRYNAASQCQPNSLRWRIGLLFQRCFAAADDLEVENYHRASSPEGGDHTQLAALRSRIQRLEAQLAIRLEAPVAVTGASSSNAAMRQAPNEPQARIGPTSRGAEGEDLFEQMKRTTANFYGGDGNPDDEDMGAPDRPGALASRGGLSPSMAADLATGFALRGGVPFRQAPPVGKGSAPPWGQDTTATSRSATRMWRLHGNDPPTGSSTAWYTQRRSLREQRLRTHQFGARSAASAVVQYNRER